MNDLKKQKELSRLASYYMQCASEESDKKQKIAYTLYAQAISDPTKYHISPHINFNDDDHIKQEQEKNNSIISFRGTFLSNFYPCSVSYNNTLYKSVEHAYQAAKFTHDINTYLSDSQRNIINMMLEKKRQEQSKRIDKRTISVVIDKSDSIFTHPDLDAGDIKSIMDCVYDNPEFESVRQHFDPDWDEKKLLIMIDLLLQKFDTEPCKTWLMETT
jgi:predicted NAD-dependent protein-ADP-ribosyltransferase YbiA (DUF1768 family)